MSLAQNIYGGCIPKRNKNISIKYKIYWKEYQKFMCWIPEIKIDSKTFIRMIELNHPTNSWSKYKKNW